ncbi:MAG: hypothetical protein ACLR43_09210 [Faecalibacillus faecis]
MSRFCKALKCDNFAEFKKEVESGLRQANHEIKLSSQDLRVKSITNLQNV